MHERSRDLERRTRAELGLAIDIHELPEGTRTAADAAEAVGCDLGQIAKSMVMRADDELILVLTSGPHRVDEGALAEHLGVDEVEPADPDAVKATLGWSIGGVPPFAHDAPVDTYIDPSLLEHDEVWAGGGTPYAVFPIDPETLKMHAKAEAIEAFEAG